MATSLVFAVNKRCEVAVNHVSVELIFQGTTEIGETPSLGRCLNQRAYGIPGLMRNAHIEVVVQAVLFKKLTLMLQGLAHNYGEAYMPVHTSSELMICCISGRSSGYARMHVSISRCISRHLISWSILARSRSVGSLQLSISMRRTPKL